MNDFELESKLKAVQVPERPADYWEEFPSSVRMQLRRKLEVRRERPLPNLAWAAGLGLACLILALSFFPAVNSFFKHERAFRRDLAELPHHLRVLMADEHGMHYLIADQ